MNIELFNVFTLGMLAAAASAFAAFFCAAFRRHHTRPLGWAMVVMLMAILQVLLVLPEVFGLSVLRLRLSLVDLVLDMTIVPVCSVMVLELTAVKRNPRWYPILHILPYLGFFLAALFVPRESSKLFLEIVMIVTAIYATAILAYGLFAIWRYNKRLRLLYADTENRDLTWLYAILLLIYALEMFWCIAIPINLTPAISLYYLFAILVWSLVTYFMLKHQDSSLIIDYDPSEASALSPEQREVIARTMPFVPELRQLEAEETFFLTPGLTITDLSLRVGTNRSYLSEYLNKVCDMSFYDYINAIRVRHAAKLLQSEDRMRQEDIMKASGFATMSTFRKAFIAVYGCSPMDYRKRSV